MTKPNYEYRVKQCDVPEVRHASLREYRKHRRKCMEYLWGNSDTSIVCQIQDLAWYTAVFRTLNEARRLEPAKSVNGAFWELTSVGYAHLMALGIRKLVDKDSRTNSVCSLISQIERRPELLTREMFICYDGLPYDWQKVQMEYIASLEYRNGGQARWVPNSGPKAYEVSRMMHNTFDRLCGNPKKPNRRDTIDTLILKQLKEALLHPAIKKVCNFANKRMAHAERPSKSANPVSTTTYEDIDNALKQIVLIVNFLSTSFFYDTAFGSIVPIPQFDVLEGLDQPWISTENVENLRHYWNKISETIDGWTYNEGNELLLPQVGS